MRRAFFQLRNGRPGPVLLEVPADLWNDEVPDDWVHTPSFRARTGPDPAAVADAAQVLASAERPVIYAGQGMHIRPGLGGAPDPGRNGGTSR